jgi:CP family cyanate transporter-like MFS transporter
MQQERPALTQPSVHFQRLAGFTPLCLVLAAFNLRPALTSLSTMLTEIQDGLQISSFWAGILTTIPVLCFGIFGPLAPVLSSRIGVERAIFLLFLVLATGIGLRQFDFKTLLVLSTLTAGASIGMAGVLVPVVIRRDFPRQIGLMTGLYTMVLSIGGATGAGLTPMIERHFGTWNSALAVWSVPAFLAAVLWGLTALTRPQAARAARMPPFSMLLRDPIAWAVTGYMGLQAALAFIVLGWLPTLLRDRGLDIMDAGFVTSMSIIAQTITALLTPVLATRIGSPRTLVMAVLLLSVAGFLGLHYAPIEGRLVWGFVLGLGQGGTFALALLFISLRSPSAETAAMLSGMSQSIGYLGASLGPLMISLLRDFYDGPNGSAGLFIAVAGFAVWCGFRAAEPNTVLSLRCVNGEHARLVQ